MSRPKQKLSAHSTNGTYERFFTSIRIYSPRDPCMYDLATILMGALLTALLDSSTALRDGVPFLIHFWYNALPNVFDNNM